MKIKNKAYRSFLDDGIIDIIDLNEIKQALEKITGKYKQEGRCFLVALYYTGARPNEVLQLKGKDVEKETSYIKVRLPASKKGLPRTLFFPYRFTLIKELYNYASALYPEQFLFYHYQTHYKRKTPKGSRIEITGKVGYYIKKWFKGKITPYFLRHNRFSQLSEAGLPPQELRMMKGSRTLESVHYYVHLSTRSAKKIAKKIK